MALEVTLLAILRENYQVGNLILLLEFITLQRILYIDTITINTCTYLIVFEVSDICPVSKLQPRLDL